MYNKPWMDAAIKRGDDIVLTTVPDQLKNYINKRTGELMGNYAKELEYLVQRNYKPKNITDKKWSEIKSWFKR